LAFRFPLETLLRLRISQEHQQELLLQAANERVTRVRRQLDRLNSLESNLAAGEKVLLQDGVPAAELHFADECFRVLEERKQALRKELAEAEQALAARIAAFEEARRQRRLMEELRERCKQIYRQQESRREQRSLDDLYLLLRGRRSPG
jgi:flagellar FliJ protein